MRYIWIILCAAVFTITGCDQKQQDQANQGAAKANEAAKQAGDAASKAIENGKKSLTDAEISAKIKTALSASDKLKDSDLAVSTKDKVATIKGTVVDDAQKELALRIAKDTVDKDVQLMDQIAVTPSAKPVK